MRDAENQKRTDLVGKDDDSNQIDRSNYKMNTETTGVVKGEEVDRYDNESVEDAEVAIDDQVNGKEGENEVSKKKVQMVRHLVWR